MRAVRVERFGTPAVLEVKAIPDPVARSNEVVVAVRAAAVNPVDVGNVAGRVELTRLPRTPGLDFAGSWWRDRNACGAWRCGGPEATWVCGRTGRTRSLW
jgi:NADPH:quinone reductase-like Zn-dependent oxidoreductase